MTNPTEPDLASVMRKRAKRVRAILGVNCNTALIEGAVATVLVAEDRLTNQADIRRVPTNKREKAAVDRVARQLRRLNAALNNSALPKFVAKLFQREELRKHAAQLDVLARRALGKPKRSAVLKRRAADQAAFLLQEHRLPWTTTRGGTLCRVTAELLGDKDAGVFDYCRRFGERRRRRKPGMKLSRFSS